MFVEDVDVQSFLIPHCLVKNVNTSPLGNVPNTLIRNVQVDNQYRVSAKILSAFFVAPQFDLYFYEKIYL